MDRAENTPKIANGCEQADVVFRLHEVLRPRLAQERMATVYEHYDRPLVATLFEMEKNGVAVNAAGLKELSAELENRQHELEKEIFALAGEEFNLGSPKQIGEILYGKLGLKGKKSAGGGYQTGAEVLEKMAEEHPLPAKILDWRAVTKLKSTYTDALLPLIDGNGRVHTTYSQTTVNTGRLSSVNPNLQNIPVRSEDGLKIRRCFVARPGCRLISADYSQVELRLMAVLAGLLAALLGGTTLKGPEIKFNFNPAAGVGRVSLNYVGRELASVGMDMDLRFSGWLAGAAVYLAATALVVVVLLFVVGSVVNVGYSKFNLNLVDGQQANISRLFCYFPW